jgi:adenosylhomocysteine nucleosidase
LTRTAFIAAMPGELKPLVRGWQHQRSNGVDLWLHRDENLYVAACAGAGQAAATRAFAEVEKEAPIDLVFSLGWAGGLRTEITAGSVHNLGGVIDVRTGERFRCDADSGPLWMVTSPVVADHAEKLRLAQAYGAAVVDMEAAAIGRLAAMRSIPFYCIKAVSDALNEPLPDLNPFLAPDGHFRTARFTLFALMRPWYWPTLVRMGENSKRAAAALREAVSEFLAERD